MTTVWLARSALDAMVTEAIRTDPSETGGILLGYHATNHDAVIVTEIIGPGPEAIHLTSEYEPDYEYQDTQISIIYETRLDEPTYYLGDWHTHTKNISRLSQKDKKTLRTIAKDPGAYAPKPIMIVLKNQGFWSPVAWQLNKRLVSGIPFGWLVTKCCLKVFDSR